MQNQLIKNERVQKELNNKATIQGAMKTGRYLYAVIPRSEEQILTFSGIGGNPVYAISHGKVSAVVGDVPNEKIRPERRHLGAHHEILKQLMNISAVLPVRFGIIANGSKAVQKILSGNQEAFIEQLDHVAGKVEMGLRVTWDVPNIFEHFISTHPELRAVRDRLFGSHSNPTPGDKIELGQIFEHSLNHDRETYTEIVENALSERCFEIKENKCRNEMEVMNLACLVGREEEALFESSVFEVAKQFDNNFAFDYNGPWPPASFVEIDLGL